MRLPADYRTLSPAEQLLVVTDLERVNRGLVPAVGLSPSLNRRALAYWSVDKSGWQVDPGKFVVFVGDSSENTPLTQDFKVQ